ncbi:uncharacterized protein GGS22DRAFT_183164 [Annulohypoxylon maeteangense]|uniref:uncharacterized protein n=1 Tax=Annulohypoxylon maeteangense TaxID=1927788 RepID=UPI002007BFBB|nr:uncharacterized protein GGS22DRAFT_183164 [Annulohypoxylon maeteangense]KAI0889820.1 hypothetical protein GGS22DRAFT_183164 [Annulohypoxylon maeteangense]
MSDSSRPQSPIDDPPDFGYWYSTGDIITAVLLFAFSPFLFILSFAFIPSFFCPPGNGDGPADGVRGEVTGSQVRATTPTTPKFRSRIPMTPKYYAQQKAREDSPFEDYDLIQDAPLYEDF